MGVEHVGIGTHFNTTVMPWVTDALMNAGFSELDATKVLGANYLRVLRQVLPG
jgi:microsomal dipeptidase-like Zn-dependent dipeptidase